MNGKKSPKTAELLQVLTTIKDLGYDVSLNWANGGVAVETNNGAETISPRLSVPNLLDWAQAYRKGIQHERARASREAKFEAALEADHKASTKV